jgi:hypothetical protein
METEASKPWLETVRLGQKIAHELGLDHTNNLLSRWMAHRVAELMERAKNAPSEEECEVARRECGELIMSLWERRMDWPQGGPLTHILPTLCEITSELEGRGWQEPKLDGTWMGLVPVLNSLQKREKWVCFHGIFSDASKEAADRSRLWLEEHIDELSEEEKQLIEIYIDGVDVVESENFTLEGKNIPNFSSLSPEERTAHLKEALRRIEEERQKKFESTFSHEEKLRAIEPNPMVGNIAENEEKHGEYFALLQEQIEVVYGDNGSENSDDSD